MANSCCQESYTECNKIVTIAYLKSFVGNNIQNTTDGSAMSVNSSDDNYCPTYGELVGGALVQNHVAAASGRWSDDVDGITVGGGYANNECVRQEDLSLTYTRFKSLTSSAASRTFSACGDNTTLSYTYTLTRTKKSMNPNCTVDTVNTDGTDTNNAKITNTSSNASFSVTKTSVSAGKNGPTTSCPATAPSRSTTITTKVNFRGTEHSAAGISITQGALTGDYSKFEYSYDTITSVTASAVGTTDFGCAGGTGTARGTAYYDTYNVYSWVDSCGANYPSCTDTRYAGSGSNSLGTKTVSFGQIDPCEEGRDYSDTKYATFSSGGYSDSVRFDQYCDYDPDECVEPCEDDCYESEPYDSWDNETEQNLGTISCSGGTFEIEDEASTWGDIYRASGTSEACQDCPDKRDVHYYTAYGGTVIVECNNTSSRKYFSGTAPGGRKYYGYLAPGPCCPDCACEPTYTQTSRHTGIAASGATITITWRKTYPNCTNPACTSGTVSEEVQVPCNSGAARTYSGTSVNGYGTWTASQRSGTTATCATDCDCYSATTPATVTASSYSATSAQVSFTVNKRVGGTWGSPTARTENVTFSANTGSSAVNRTGVITLNDCNSCDGNCEDKLKVNWTVVVPGNPCTCADIEPTGTTAVTIPQSGGTYEFTYSNCVGYVGWTSSSWAVPSRTSRTFTITAAENNTTSARTVSLTFTFYLQEGDTTPCGTYTVEITQAGKFECPEYSIGAEIPDLDWRGGSKRFNVLKNN